MRIRSLTIGAALPTDEAARASLIARLGEFARAGRAALEAAGFAVQTTRLSTQPAERWLSVSGGLLATVSDFGRACESQGLDYCSLGTIQAQQTQNGDRPVGAVGGRERSEPREPPLPRPLTLGKDTSAVFQARLQAFIPPSRDKASKPPLRKRSAAIRLVFPAAHTVTTGLSPGISAPSSACASRPQSAL